MEKGSSGVLVSDGVYVLLAKRNCNPDVSFPGHWSPFAGAIESGECAEEAAKRELFEESGIKVKGKLTLLKKINRNSDGDFFLYLYMVPEIPAPVIDFEHTEWGIFRIENISVSPEPIDQDIVEAVASISDICINGIERVDPDTGKYRTPYTKNPRPT
jgi:8-oxo-dGTP pyrophosphatase MutT (NUDIX family)